VRKLAFVVAAALVVLSFCAAGQAQAQVTCTPVKIQAGGVVDSANNSVKTGYDKYGYNYVAHLFNGLVDNYTRPTEVVTDGTENLVMKWSDDWLANVSCAEFTGVNVGKLARGYDAKAGTVTGTSMGWCTNHFEGDYLGEDGEMHHYTYFVKIVYVGPPPVGSPDPWGGDVSVGGKRIWGQYAVVEEIQTDPYGGYGGRLKLDKLVPPGLGLGSWIPGK